MSTTNNLDFNQLLTPRIRDLYAIMDETRKRLFEQIEGISQEQLEFTPSERKIETIGTLLFHILAVEYSWIYKDIFKEEMDYEEYKYAFALREDLHPPQLTGKPLSFYVDKMNSLRNRVFSTLKTWKNEDLDREVTSGKNTFTIYWILYHVNYHESIHIGQINFLKRLYKIQKDDK